MIVSIISIIAAILVVSFFMPVCQTQVRQSDTVVGRLFGSMLT
ncbi:hypothetical protein ACFL6S_27880 [Candidatus Poribacteria bacterium]